jgi:succinylglutamate desuccinylase
MTPPPPPEPSDVSRRLVCRIKGSSPGPMLLVIGGLHGNEPDGLQAMRAVAARLEGCFGDGDPGAGGASTHLRGDVVMLAGNLPALEQGRRFLERDLNRGWRSDRIAALRRSRAAGPPGVEDLEQLELAAAIEAAASSARGRIHAVDLHATSADGVPFVMATEREEDRALARLLPLPLVLGLLETVEQTLAMYLVQRGCVVLAVEGGQRARDSSAANLEAILWLLLAGIGLLDPEEVPGLDEHRRRLEHARAGLPRRIRVHHRHAVRRGDGFRMEPAFTNIQRVSRGQLLARCSEGEIRAAEEGYVVLPVYQPQGDDGFFLGVEDES